MSTGWPSIPRHLIDVRFSRSGGPGGQNVNKVETKAEIRFVLATATWIPDAIRQRLLQRLASRLTSAGELVLSSSSHRSQSQNLEECYRKLEQLLREHGRPPRRRIATVPTHGSVVRTARAKKRRHETKRQRRWRASDD